MCYYATTDYLCGDWKWGNMMLRCPRQHRIGETCGAKLIHSESITKSGTICKTCDEISTKQRRLSKTHENISRWSKEPDKFSASLEKARREAKELDEKIKDLHLRRPSIATNIHSGASPVSSRSSSTIPVGATTLPPVAAMTASTAPRYEYTSSQGMGRRQEGGAYGTPRNPAALSVSSPHAMNLSAAPMANTYGSLPAANYVTRGGSAMSPTNVAMDRQGGSYKVSYVRQ